MDTSPVVLRYERKFLAHGSRLAQVVALVRRHPALFREVYPPRTVNNLYLDTIQLQDYADHVGGVANRAKTRVRWYGALDGTIGRPVLERKLRRGAVSGKVSCGLPALRLPEGATYGDLDLSGAWAALPARLYEVVSRLRPSLLNRYQRRYFLSADGRYRLTVDWDLQFLDPGWSVGQVRPLGPPDPAVVLELKFGVEHAAGAAEVSGALPFRMSRCSKYVLGVDATRGRGRLPLGLGRSAVH